MSPDPSARQTATTVVEALRRELLDDYGWTLLDVACEVDEDRRSISLGGRVAVTAIARRLADRLRDAMGPAWSVTDRCRALRGSSWHVLDTRTPVSRCRPGHDAGQRLATEYLPGDGPVQLLVVGERGCLIRGRDGTVGWLDGVPGAAVEPPGSDDPPVRADVAGLRRALRDWVGVDYRLGGTTRDGVDCSALMQRVYAAAMNLRLPRNTADQLAIGSDVPESPSDLDAGDLCFLWSRDEAPHHVGSVVHSNAVVHASRSRGRVVEDSLDRWFSAASRLQRVPLARLLEHAQQQWRRPILDGVGPRSSD